MVWILRLLAALLGGFVLGQVAGCTNLQDTMIQQVAETGSSIRDQANWEDLAADWHLTGLEPGITTETYIKVGARIFLEGTYGNATARAEGVGKAKVPPEIREAATALMGQGKVDEAIELLMHYLPGRPTDVVEVEHAVPAEPE